MRILVNKIMGFDEDGKELHYIEASGDSSEDKPTDESIGGVIIDGSNVIESNSGKGYFYNEKSSSWIEA